MVEYAEERRMKMPSTDNMIFSSHFDPVGAVGVVNLLEDFRESDNFSFFLSCRLETMDVPR